MYFLTNKLSELGHSESVPFDSVSVLDALISQSIIIMEHNRLNSPKGSLYFQESGQTHLSPRIKRTRMSEPNLFYEETAFRSHFSPHCAKKNEQVTDRAMKVQKEPRMSCALGVTENCFFSPKHRTSKMGTLNTLGSPLHSDNRRRMCKSPSLLYFPTEPHIPLGESRNLCEQNEGKVSMNPIAKHKETLNRI